MRWRWVWGACLSTCFGAQVAYADDKRAWEERNEPRPALQRALGDDGFDDADAERARGGTDTELTLATEPGTHEDVASRLHFVTTSAAGVAFTQGLDGGTYVRWALDVMVVSPEREPLVPSLVAGYTVGLDAWGNPGARGGGLPFSFYGGVHLGEDQIGVMLRAGVGASLVVVDEVDSVVGGGIYAPLATLELATDSPWFRLSYDFRVQYRWEWRLDDRLQTQFGASMSFPLALDLSRS